MSAPHPPRPKSLASAATGPRAAEQAVAPQGVGAPKVVAEGVPSAVLPDPHQPDGRYPVAWLHISAPRAAVPTATSKCTCGWDRSAIGRNKVRHLIDLHTTHRDTCPLRTPQEGRQAA
ncbi:hypothetical protein [Streptomyces sp. CA-251247]|uniref:hypothetical protein n=1 Tax=Streptomyces sp. CA-251247 TaxID=3240062 RepID=UPI003D8D1F14